MRTLLVAPYAPPERGAAVVRLQGMVEELKNRNHEVSALAPARPAVSSNETVERYRGVRELFFRVFSSKAEIVIGTSPPITHDFFALLASQWSGKKFVLDAKDPFTYFYEKQNPEKAAGSKFWFYRFIERYTISQSTRVLALSEYNARYIQRKFHVPKERVWIAPNGSDFDSFKKNGRFGESERKKHGIPKNALVLLYAGVIGGKDLDEMIQSIAPTVKKNGYWLAFAVTHDGTEHGKKALNQFNQWIQKNGLAERTIVEVNQPYSAMPAFFSMADLALNPIASYDEFCIPTKTYDYIASGMPVLSRGPPNSALEEFMELHPIGRYCRSWAEFNQFIQDPMLREKAKKTIEQNQGAFSKIFSRKDSMKEFVRRLEGLR